jgi:hypothetical protein
MGSSSPALAGPVTAGMSVYAHKIRHVLVDIMTNDDVTIR